MEKENFFSFMFKEKDYSEIGKKLCINKKSCPFIIYGNDNSVKYIGKGLLHTDIAVKIIKFANFILSYM